MRLLVDQNLPRRLVALLLAAAHEAAHTEDEGLATATDPVILSWCCTHDRTLVTADKKMTKFFSGSGSTCPSVLVVRDLRTLAVERIAAMLVANLEQIESIPAYTDTSSEPLGSLSIVPRRRFHRVPEQATQEGWRSFAPRLIPGNLPKSEQQLLLSRWVPAGCRTPLVVGSDRAGRSPAGWA